mgnify:CR=1 FL=1
MSQPYILAAVNRQQLHDARRALAEHGLAVFGTMDGSVLDRLRSAVPGGVTVYFYEPG